MPQYIQDALGLGKSLSTLGAAAFRGIRGYAEQNNITIQGLPEDPDAPVPPEQALHVLHNFFAVFFPRLHPTAPSPGQQLVAGPLLAEWWVLWHAVHPRSNSATSLVPCSIPLRPLKSPP